MQGFNKYIIILKVILLAFILLMFLVFLPILQSPFLFYTTYLLLFLYLLGIDETNYKQIFRPKKHVKILFSFLSFSFIILSILFGFHTDVLTQYDDQTTGVNWLDMKNILCFPLKMSQVNKGDFNDNLRIKKLDDFNSLNLIYIDNTCSASENLNSEMLLEALNKDEIKEIDSSSINTSNQIISISILKNIADINANAEFVFYNYKGQKKEPILFFNNPKLNTSSYYEKKWDCFSTLIKFFSKNNDSRSYTNISEFLNINETLKNKYSKYSNINLFFVSDFIDNALYSSYDLKSLIKNPNISSINLIRTNGNDNNGKQVFEEIKKNILKCEKATFNELDFLDTMESISSKLKFICANNNYKNKTENCLHFYYPKKEMNNNFNIICQFVIEKNEVSDYEISIRDQDELTNSNVFEIKESMNPKTVYQSNINKDAIKLVGISSNDTIKIKVGNFNNITNHRCFVDIYDVKNQTINSFPIKALDTLPFSNIYILLILYSILISSICLIFFYILYTSYLKRLVSNKKLTNIHFCLCSLSILPMLYFLFINFSDITLFIIVAISFLFILSITIIHFLKNIKFIKN